MSRNLFEGNLVRLRAVETADWEFFQRWTLDSEVARNDYMIEFPQSLDIGRAWAEAEARRGARNDEFRFVIETLAGQQVGSLNTHSCNPRHGTFMYGVSVLVQEQRKGYASEALKLVLRYFFEEKRYQKVNAEVYSFNEASIRLHESLGYTLEGRLRRMIYSQGEHHDTLIYGLTIDDFKANPRLRING